MTCNEIEGRIHQNLSDFVISEHTLKAEINRNDNDNVTLLPNSACEASKFL